MLLYLSHTAAEDSQEYKGLFYTNPLLVRKFYDHDDIEDYKKVLSKPRPTDWDDGAIPVMKTINIKIHEEIDKDQKT